MESHFYTYRAKVTAVYDGDTLTADIDLGFSVVLKGQKIRLARINAPEVRGPSRPAGIKSRDALRAQVLGRTVVLRTIRDSREKYGRMRGEIWIDGACVNDWLISEGHAIKYT